MCIAAPNFGTIGFKFQRPRPVSHSNRRRSGKRRPSSKKGGNGGGGFQPFHIFESDLYPITESHFLENKSRHNAAKELDNNDDNNNANTNRSYYCASLFTPTRYDTKDGDAIQHRRKRMNASSVAIGVERGNDGENNNNDKNKQEETEAAVGATAENSSVKTAAAAAKKTARERISETLKNSLNIQRSLNFQRWKSIRRRSDTATKKANSDGDIDRNVCYYNRSSRSSQTKNRIGNKKVGNVDVTPLPPLRPGRSITLGGSFNVVGGVNGDTFDKAVDVTPSPPLKPGQSITLGGSFGGGSGDSSSGSKVDIVIDLPPSLPNSCGSVQSNNNLSGSINGFNFATDLNGLTA